jgi:hypothetical protein
VPTLPDRPNLRQLRHQAKDLLKSFRADAPDARRRFDACRPEPGARPPTDIKLAHALRVIAREYGFDGWAALKQTVEALPTGRHDGVPPSSANGGASQADASFADTVDLLETAREELRDMFEPGSGWEWHTVPRKCAGQPPSMYATRGAVIHTMRGDVPAGSGNPAPLLVYIAQGGAEGDPKRKLRPVFYDREGARHVLHIGGPNGGSRAGGWYTRHGFTLNPEALEVEDIAFFGIEAKLAHDDETV